MSLPTMTAPPTAPTVSDDSQTFNTRAFALAAWFATHVAEQSLWAAALPSVITGTDFSATSTTSLTVGTGSKSLTIQTGKQFQIGQPVRIAYTTTPSDFMDGQVTAYNSGTGAMTVNVTAVGGSGTQSAWTVSLLPGSGSDFVTLTGTQTLTNKTLSAPVISNGTSSVTGTLGFSGGVLTYGDGGNTRLVVSTEATQTLTNKTFDMGVGGNIGKVNGNTLAASAGTATITLPNSTDTLVGRATTDTLTNKTLTSAILNGGTLGNTSGLTITARNTVSDDGTIAATSPGFRGIPQNAKTAAYELVLTDQGKHISITTGGITIPANASVAFPIGSTVVIYNDSSSSQTIAITSDTLRLAGTASTGSRTVAQRGLATLVKVASSTWVISGAGVS